MLTLHGGGGAVRKGAVTFSHTKHKQKYCARTTPKLTMSSSSVEDDETPTTLPRHIDMVHHLLSFLPIFSCITF